MGKLENRSNDQIDNRQHGHEYRPVAAIRPNFRNARTHSKKQVRQIAESIRRFGFNNPILVDEQGEVIAGHGRLEAAKFLGLKEVPTLCLEHLNEAQKRAYILADNKIAMNAGWDSELLATELGELTTLLPDIDIDLEITGFDTGEIDLILLDQEEPNAALESEDEAPAESDVQVAKHGDVWQLGSHKLLCEDSRNSSAVAQMFASETAALTLTDPPYNVKVQGHVGGRGKVHHEEFAFASGEMSDEQFGEFLRDSLEVMAEHSQAGALFYVFMDWRHIELLLAAGRELKLALKNICVWNKTTPGQGSFYRSTHELVAVFAKRGSASTNNVELGRYGRNRTNVWTYPGVNTFQTGKGDDLTLHPTVKPVTMIAEAIKDASKRREIVFDPFLGSGTTLLAAEKTGRRCYGVEYEPKYINTAIMRWQQMTGKDAVLLSEQNSNDFDVSRTGKCFDDLTIEDISVREVE